MKQHKPLLASLAMATLLLSGCAAVAGSVVRPVGRCNTRAGTNTGSPSRQRASRSRIRLGRDGFGRAQRRSPDGLR